jgi:hypothetical protein
MNVLAEKKTSVKYRNQYLAKVIEGRVGDTPAAVQPSALPPPQLGADGEDGETVQEGLTKSPAKLAFKLGKKIKKPKRSRGRGWKMNYAVLDESYVCVNHVARKTLYDKASGEKVHRLEGAGKRVCMAGCGIYWGNSGNNEPHFEVYDIANEHGHLVYFTPAYCPLSNPIEKVGTSHRRV